MTKSSYHGKFLTGIYPGTFDPMTRGHLHLMKRASTLVDRLIIGVADNSRKAPLFNQSERLNMIKNDIAALDVPCDLIVKPFDNLLVDFAKTENASCIFRGLRAVSDFEFEFQMTGMNAKLDPSIETVFLMAADQWQFVSSSFIKEICAMGGDIDQFVSAHVAEKLKEKLN